MSFPDSIKTEVFFRYTIYLFYGIVVAQSYEIAKDNLIPLTDIFSDSSHQLHSFGIFLAYFMLISSWVGYHRSISKKPHSNNMLGTTRYVLDIFVVFSTFYLLHISTTEYFTEQYPFVLSLIFVLYIFWDSLKCKEYPEPTTKKKKRETTRAGKTVLFSILFVIFTFSHVYFTYNWDLIFSSSIIFEVSFIIIAGILIAVYRFWKWRVPRTRTHINKKSPRGKRSNKT